MSADLSTPGSVSQGATVLVATGFVAPTSASLPASLLADRPRKPAASNLAA